MENDPNVPNIDLNLSSVKVFDSIHITEVNPFGNEVNNKPGEAEKIEDFKQPIDLLNEKATSLNKLFYGPAVGAIIRSEQAWRMKGLTKGKLLHSLCLAPGEVTQVAMTNWERSTSGSSSETTQEDELASKSASQDRVMDEVTDAVVKEMQSGASASTTSSNQVDGGVGGIMGLLGGSASASTNSSSASNINWSMGTRNASAHSVQNIREKTAQHASNVRSKKSTLVQEVSMHENEKFSSRVIANYNHMHSLNMQYYEVLQNYELSTKVTHAERCIFLPMQLIKPFNKQAVNSFGPQLAKAARALGKPILANAISHFIVNAEQGKTEIARLKSKIQKAQGNLSSEESTVQRYKKIDEVYNHKISDLLKNEKDLKQELLQKSNDLNDIINRRNHEKLKVLEQINAKRDPIKKQINEINSKIRNAGIGRPMAAALSEPVIAELKKQIHGLNIAERNALGALDANYTTPIKIAKIEVKRAKVEVQNVSKSISSFNSSKQNNANAIKGAQRTVDQKRKELSDAQLALKQYNEGLSKSDVELMDELNDDNLYFNQAIWAQMDSATIEAMLRGLQIAGTPLLETVDPNPIAVEGLYLGFRWSFPDTPEGKEAAIKFQKKYVTDAKAKILDARVFATGGVFAESVLGRSIAAEKLDATRNWKWDENTIPILPTKINALKAKQREQRAEAIPGSLGATSVQLQQLAPLPALPGNDLTNIIGANIFRDMSGSEVIGGLLKTAQDASAEQSAHAQQLAHENISKYLDHVEEMFPKLLSAVAAAGGGGMDPSTLGALSNTLSGGGAEDGGKGGAEQSFDVGKLMDMASKVGMMLA